MKIKEPPKDLKFKATSFMDGAKGWAAQTYRNVEYGITVFSERENHESPFVRVFAHDQLEDGYSNLEELIEAIRENNEKQPRLVLK